VFISKSLTVGDQDHLAFTTTLTALPRLNSLMVLMLGTDLLHGGYFL